MNNRLSLLNVGLCFAVVATFFFGLDRASAQQRVDNQLAKDLAVPTQDEVTLDEISQFRTQLPADNEKLAADVEEILKTAEANLKQADSLAERNQTHQNVITNVDERKKVLQDQNPEEPVLSEAWENASLDDLDRLVKNQAAATSQSQELAEQAATELGQRIARRQQIRERLLVVNQNLEELKPRVIEATVADDWIVKANQLEIQTKIQSLQKEALSLDSELARLDAEDRADLPNLRTEFLKKQAASRQATLDEMQGKLNRMRTAAAAEMERKTQLSQLGQEPALASSFEKNLKLAEDNREVTGEISQSADRLKAREQKLSDLRKQFAEARSRVTEIGLTSAVGAMLRNQKDQLPTALELKINSQNSTAFSEIQFQLFDATQQAENLTEKTIQNEAMEESADLTAAELERLAEPISQLKEQRAKLLDVAKKNFREQYETLIKLDLANSQLSTLVKDYRDFINERILWIRSNKVLFASLEMDASDRSVAKSSQWTKVSNLLLRDWKRNLWTYLICIGGIFGLLLLKPRMRRAVDEFGVEASRGGCTSFWPTAKSLLLSSLLALIVPLILLFAGWRLTQASAQGLDYGKMISALANAFLMTSWYAIPVEILKRFCRRSGLGHKHFNWSNDAVDTIRTNLRWASTLGSLVVFLVSFFYFLDTRHQNDLIERVLFLGGMGVMAVLLYRCLNPEKGIFRNYLRQHENSWANQLRFVWFGLFLAVPVALGILAVVGYYYTSLNLAVCVFMTFVFGLIVETLRALLMRFILIRRRHAHIELARRRRRQQKDELKKAQVEEQGELAAAVSLPSVSDSELLEDFNVDANATQSRKLIALCLGVIWFLGLWMIWTDVLPALRALDRYPVWPPVASTTETVDASIATGMSESTEDGGGAAVVSGESDEATTITIRDLLVFFLIAVITFVLARNLPGLMEMTFLNHLPVEPSVRYASKSILSYLIILLGTMLAFRSIQVGWSQVQWLATALTFGLAFGLQEIFANFVAGIILLFERPIRIGDVITVDDVTGVVTKIRTRATTVSNWDRKEYVVPNKEFITGRVLNWTLSDQLNRIVIHVGVAYGSDVELAKATLLNICQDHPLTTDQPASNVTFEQFADSSLLLTVRTFVPDIDSRLKVIDQLHTSINAAFEEKGIEISFPQMDIHFRTADENLLNSLKS